MPMNPDCPTVSWRRFLLRGLFTQGFCVAIALMLWSVAHDSLGWSLAYSLAIGNCSWLAIDGGMHAIALLLGRGEQRRDTGLAWPGVPGMLAAVIAGSAIGYSLGSTLVDAFSGHRSPSLWSGRVPGIISVLAAVSMTYFFFTRERLAAEKATAEAAQRSAVEHQLRLLESQLEPHMLFNTLANLRVLITLDPPRAQAMLDRLIAFLRATLGASRSGAHTLRAEFDRLADYLALMQVRMGNRLQVQLDLPPELAEQTIPALLLQPLVENAVVHGLEPRVEGGRLQVQARREPGRLVLTVRDTGVGIDAARVSASVAAPPGHEGALTSGFGTQQVRERLAMLHGARANLRLEPAPDEAGGTLATVVLPMEA